MIQTKPTILTFEEFLEYKAENRCYELHDGVIVEMQPTGEHEDIIEFMFTHSSIILLKN
jgi:Uma2 family endonuclease